MVKVSKNERRLLDLKELKNEIDTLNKSIIKLEKKGKNMDDERDELIRLKNEYEKLDDSEIEVKENTNKQAIVDLNDKFLLLVDEILKVKNPNTRANNTAKWEKKLKIIVDEGKANKIIKKSKIVDFAKLAQTLYEAQKHFDFFPTPKVCFDVFEKYIKDYENIIEPCVGMGHLLNNTRRTNQKANLTAIEFYNPFLPYFKIFNPDVEFNPNKKSNFLEYNPKKNNYDLLIINPPFSNKTDKIYYFDFLFHSFYIMGDSDVSYETSMIFISPQITKEKVTVGDIFFFSDILKKISMKKLKTILESYDFKFSDKEIKFLVTGNENLFKLEKDLSKAQKLVDSVENTFEPLQCMYLGPCVGFGGTKTKADMYHFIVKGKSWRN